MKTAIIESSFTLAVHGFSGTAVNKDYAATAFSLMNRMWQAVNTAHLKNKGLNIWVYDKDEKIFAGVELMDATAQNSPLEHTLVHMPKYAYHKHIGPYHLIKQAGQAMRDELKASGYQTCFPYIEIYGHWTNDETKLETELLMCLK